MTRAHLDSTTTRRGSAKRNAAFTRQHGAMLTTRQPEGCVPVVVSRCAQMTKETRIPKSESRDQRAPSSLGPHCHCPAPLQRSPIPLQKIRRQRFERDGFAAENFQGVKRTMGELLSDLLRLLHPDDRRIGRL